MNWCARERKARGLDSQDEVTKTFTITGPRDFMLRLELFLSFVSWLGAVGHSAVAGLPVDGDGSDRIKVAEKLPKIKEDDILTKGTYPTQYEYVKP